MKFKTTTIISFLDHNSDFKGKEKNIRKTGQISPLSPFYLPIDTDQSQFIANGSTLYSNYRCLIFCASIFKAIFFLPFKATRIWEEFGTCQWCKFIFYFLLSIGEVSCFSDQNSGQNYNWNGILRLEKFLSEMNKTLLLIKHYLYLVFKPDVCRNAKNLSNAIDQCHQVGSLQCILIIGISNT